MEEKKAATEEILQFLEDCNAPVAKKEIYEDTGLDPDTVQPLLEELEREGRIMQSRHKKYALPQVLGCIAGKIQGNQKGFAFLIPDDREMPDVYLPIHALMGAMHEDRALVRITVRNKGGNARRQEGEVVKILSRARDHIVGKFERNASYGFVTPEDRRITPDIFVPKEGMGKAQTGDMVVVRITQWAQENRSTEGEIAEVLGRSGSLAVDIKSILYHYGIPNAFSEEAIQQAQKMAQEVDSQEADRREDFRDRLCVTIDGADAKDLDDAITLERKGQGYLLGVHIADVSHYVQPNSPLDRDAYERGTSVYFPDHVIPMLPKELSNGICSLNMGVDRLTLSCLMEMDETGRMLGARFTKGVIRVTKRVTYEDANAFLERGDEDAKKGYEAVYPMLVLMQELAEKLMTRRNRRGYLDLDLPESKIILDEAGKTADIRPYERGISNQMIEEFMLSANEAAAQQASAFEMPFLYRVHERPDEEKMQQLYAFVSTQGVTARRPQNEIHTRDLQHILERAKGLPQEGVISRILLRSLKKAKYSERNMGHFGLALEDYCHFTSPIRRYPDLIVHRVLTAMIEGGLEQKLIEKLETQLPDMAEHTSECERKAMEAERAIDDLKKAEYMLDRIGEEYDGIISGVTDFGIFVELPNTVEGLIKISSLGDDYYAYDEKNYALIGSRTGKRYALGDAVRIKVIGVNLDTRKTEFALAQEEGDVPQPYFSRRKKYGKKHSAKKHARV